MVELYLKNYAPSKATLYSFITIIFSLYFRKLFISVSKDLLFEYFFLLLHINISSMTNTTKCILQRHYEKLYGVGPIDNRPSTDELHPFVRKKRKKIVTRDRWHVTCDMCYMTHDTLGGGEHSLKISAPLLLLFVIYDVKEIWRKRLTYSLS